MTSIPRRITPLVVALLLVAQTLFAQGLTVAKPETLGMSSERLGRLTETLQDYVDDGRLAGAVAIVARRGQIAWCFRHQLLLPPPLSRSNQTA